MILVCALSFHGVDQHVAASHRTRWFGRGLQHLPVPAVFPHHTNSSPQQPGLMGVLRPHLQIIFIAKPVVATVSIFAFLDLE